MSLPVIVRTVIVGALVVIASSASAQSLGDVARQEEARRAAVKAAARAKVLTNADLAADPNTGATAPESAVAVPAPPAASAVAPASASSGNASVAVTAATPADTKPKEDEASWRRRAADLRARVEKAQKTLDGFTNGTPAEDPREQARVETLMKRAQNELTRAGDTFRRLMMQADAAGVPPEWVR